MKKILQTAALSLPLIVLATLGLRLCLLRDYVIHHPRQALGAIPFLFEPGNIAYSLAGGHGFASPFRVETGPTAWMTPVWPLLLAAIFRVFGVYTFRAFLAAALMNVLFSTLVCVPLYFAGKRIAGREVGAAAAWLWSISPLAAVLPFESLWEGSLAALLAAALLWATAAVIGSGRMRDWIGYGLLWGAALMTSAAFLALFFLIHGWLILGWFGRQGERRKPMAAAGIALLCCLPWTVRNFAVFHAFVPLRSVMGLSLWVGNNDRADGLTPNRHPISNSAERAKYAERGEIAYMRDKRTEAIEFMWSHPGAELRLTRDRFLAFWSGGTARPMTDPVSGWLRWVLLFNLFGAAGGAAGMAILFRRHNGFAWPVALFPLVFPLPYYLTIALPRYRLPVDPALLLLTAITLQAIWQTISRGSTPGRESSRTTSHK